ncbi:Wzz/FepE/Etk N-terminal domain-containing protein [Microtetraspora niveoalba]|uniref:Wzz/FepE/Etk N-terminal domain-containing protein n=1 Tax=Microtetraspora niveoalba TaxID=46175 RepID=UPI0009FBCD27|nr:Wzz/FepE/Etk N-terminal domain-containing protein [Microtetraspora niveoalba]
MVRSSFPPPHTRDLADYGSVLRRRRLLVASCLMAGIAGGVGLLVVTPKEYAAVAQVQVLPTGVQDQVNQVTSRQREPLNLDTEAQIAHSATVAAKAAEILKKTDSEELREQVTVDVPPNSAILSIWFTAGDPISAAAGAQAFADAYLQNRSLSAARTLAAQMKALTTQLHEVDGDLGKAAESVATLPRGSAARVVAEHQQSVLGRQVYSLTLKYDALKTVAITPGAVISQARPPSSPSAPSAPLYLGSGLFLGLLAGTGAAFARDRLDTRLRAPADVERLTTLPLLADIPLRADPGAFRSLAAGVVAALGEGYHRLLVAELGTVAGPPVAERLGAALSHLAPVTVVTDPADRPGAAVLLLGLRRTTSTEVAQTVRRLNRQGTTVLGAVTVPPTLPMPPRSMKQNA